MVVPNEQMERFRTFVEGNLDRIKYVDITDLNLKAGEKVRINSGPFKGKEGLLVKVNGRRSKQVVVSIDGLLAVVVNDIDASMIERV